MDLKTLIENLVAMENAFPVETLDYRGMHIYPLIRLALYSQVIGQKNENPLSFNNAQGLQFLGRTIKQQIWHIRNAMPTLPESDALFISEPTYYSDKQHNTFYNRHTDPLYETFASYGQRVTKVELTSSRWQSTQPRTHQTIPIPHRFVPPKTLGQITHFAQFQEICRKIFPNQTIFETNIALQAEKILYYQRLFTPLLKQTQPKAVFVTTYYQPHTMGLSRACWQMGIPSVDIQHGKQGKYEGMYAQWTRIPQGGYDLLPSHFWVWGQESQNTILDWHYPQQHHAVIGGNRWLAKWSNGDGSGFGEVFSHNIQQRIVQAQKIILFTMQPLPNAFPPHVLDTIQQSPRNWLWLIRLSPQHADTHQVDQVRQLLLQNNITENQFEIEEASSLPLYRLLKIAHHHITLWSSVCYEALVFGVPSVILNHDGYNIYESYIQQGIFSYADASDALLQALHNPPVQNNASIKRPYIVVDDDIAQQAWQIIITQTT